MQCASQLPGHAPVFKRCFVILCDLYVRVFSLQAAISPNVQSICWWQKQSLMESSWLPILSTTLTSPNLLPSQPGKSTGKFFISTGEAPLSLCQHLCPCLQLLSTSYNFLIMVLIVFAECVCVFETGCLSVSFHVADIKHPGECPLGRKGNLDNPGSQMSLQGRQGCRTQSSQSHYISS